VEVPITKKSATAVVLYGANQKPKKKTKDN
jgi:hypothetical protein